MTNEQKIDMFSMRLSGHSLQEIGDKFGISRQAVQQILSTKHVLKKSSCIYPNFVNWRKDNHVTLELLSKKTGVSAGHLQTILSGKHSPTKSTIDKLLKATGLTYEEFFWTEEKPPSDGASR